MGVVAYAFTATRTVTAKRPPDERSFQLKYGSKESYEVNSHELWQDPSGLFTTLLVGIDPVEGFFVAADPEMHNPTKFFIRLEFKDEHADQIRREGWYAWERSRRNSVRPIETLVGGVRSRMLDLVRFERAARGLPPGDRQLLAERRELFVAAALGGATIELPPETLHSLASEFELAPAAILDLIAGARRLKMAVRGWVAELKLQQVLDAVPGVTWCERLDEEGGPDLRVRWKDGPPLTVECKNVLRKTNRAGQARIDFQRTRASKEDPCSRYYAPTDFDVVAGCIHAVTERWEFRYVLPSLLEGHARCPGKLASNVAIGSLWATEPGIVFESAYAALGVVR